MKLDKIMSSVKVAVRVRPLSRKEIERNSKFIVDINGDCISVTNIKVDGQADYGDSRERVKHFTFDYCYDSACDPRSPAYSSQELVFQDLGTEVLQAAFEGYNACVLAYGQTSTGKTYTMMGNQDEIGLIPRICEGLFSHVDDVMEESLSFQVKISYLEIYNERVRDLLRPSLLKANEKYTLKVREHPKDGPYVQDLSSHYVNDNSQIQSILERGNEYRTTASTYMHDHSSRSHAIVTIEFTQARIEDDLPHEIVSKIHLVDLAGSERADPSYGSHYKGRLREGANINKSLVTLGNVIKALAEKSILSWSTDNLGSNSSCHSSSGIDIGAASSPAGSPKKQRLPYIPYRDSVLTWLLRDSLGGNSKTVMISTVSPASVYYNETISTLRYAQRAKSIINKPKINEDPNVTIIRELRREIERLREMLLSARVADSRTSLNEIVFLLPPFTQKLHENEAEIKQGDNSLCSQGTTDSMLAEKLQENETMADQLTQTWIDKWREAHELIRDSDLSITGLKRKTSSMGVLIESQQPHLVGMDDDILSTGVTIYYLKDGKTLLGREDASREQDIVLKGPGIQREHCFIKNHLGTVTLHPNRNALCAVNGIDFKGPTKLKQGDYLLLGKTNMFRYNNPAEAAKLRIRRESSVEEMASQEDTERNHPDSYKAELLRPIHPIYAHFASDEICHQLDKQFDNDLQRMEEAKRELQRLQDDHRRAEEARQSKEEELWRTHDQKRAEIEEQRRTLAEIAEENIIQRQRVEEEIAYARECLEEEKEAFQKYLQEELTKLRNPTTSTEQSTQSDQQLESLNQLSEEARQVLQKTFSLEGRLKDLAQGELLKRLSYLDSEQKLIQEAEDIEDQFTVTQEQLQSDLDRLREVERNYRHSDALQLKDINTRDEAIEELEKKEQQLQGYIQEKQGLLHVGNDTPRHLRTACSEEVLTNIEGTDVDYPLRCSSLLSLQRGSEGDLPALSKRLSMASALNVKSMDFTPAGGSVENIKMEIGSASSTSLHSSSSSINSETSARSGKKALKNEQKQGKLTTTAKSVTDRLYKAPPPKFKHESKEKKTPTNTNVRSKRDIDRSKRGDSVEKDKTTRERTPVKKPEQKTVESKGVVLRKSPGRPVVSPSLQKQVVTAPRRQTNGQGAVNKEPRLRQSVSQPSLSTDQRLTSNKVLTQRLTLPNKIHKIASASSLACVPEAVGEEGDVTDQSKDSTQNVVRRRKRHHYDEDDTRRHSAPIGESLSDAFDKYKQDIMDKTEIPAIKFTEHLSPASDNGLIWQKGDMETSSDTCNIPATFTSIHSSQSQEKISMCDQTFHSGLNSDDCSPQNGDTSINNGKNINEDANLITQEMECDPSVMADTVIPVECSEQLSSAGPQSSLPVNNLLNENLVDKHENKIEGQIDGIHFKNNLNTCIEVTCKQGSIPEPTMTDVVFRSDSDTSPQESVHRSIELDSDSGFYPESSDNFESSGALSFASALASRLSVGSEQDLQSPVMSDCKSNVMEVVQLDSNDVVCSGKSMEENSHTAVDKPPLRPASFKEDGIVFSETDIDSSSVASPGDVNFFLPESSDSGPEALKPGYKRELDSEIEDSVSPAKCRKEEEGIQSAQVSSLDSSKVESAKSSSNQNIVTACNVYASVGDHEDEIIITVPVSQEDNIAQSSDKEDGNICDIALILAQSKHREDDGRYSSDSLEEDIDSLDGSKPHRDHEDSSSNEDCLNDSLENPDIDLIDLEQKTGPKAVGDEIIKLSSKNKEQETVQTQNITLLEQKPFVAMNVEPPLSSDSTGEKSASPSSAGHFEHISSRVDSELANHTSDAENKQLVDKSVKAENYTSENLAFGNRDFITTDISRDSITVEVGKDCGSVLTCVTAPESSSSEPGTDLINSVKTSPDSTENDASSSLASTSPNVYSSCSGHNSHLSGNHVRVLPVGDDKCDRTGELTRAGEMLIINIPEVIPDVCTIDTSDLNIESDGYNSPGQIKQEKLVSGNLPSVIESKNLCSTEGRVTPLEHSIDGVTDSVPPTRTLGVSTDFLTAEDGEIPVPDGEDKDSQCSHDSILELQEQLQELEDYPVTLKGAIPNNQNNNTQLSSARKAARHRAMIRQKHRGTDIESDDINQCSDDSQGNTAKPSSRPTSASRRRRRTQVKSSDKTVKQLKGLSSEECLTSESDGVLTEDSLTNKEGFDSVEEEVLTNELVSGYSQKRLDCVQDEPASGEQCEVIDENEHLSHVDGLNLTSSEQNLLNMDQLRVNGCVNLSNGDIGLDKDEKCKIQQNTRGINSIEDKDESSSVQSSSSRSPSETRDMEQQTDVSWVEGTHIFPSGIHTADPTLTVSPVSVWTSGEKGLAVYGPQRPQSRTSSTESSPVKRRKKGKTVKLEITSPDIWSSEDIDLSSAKTTITTPSEDSDEDDCTYIMETEVYSPQSPSSSDKFFTEAPSKPIKYHVTVNEESTNITYNIDRTEYRTYGLRSQIQNPDTVRIPETININLTESSTEVIDNRLESIRTEHVNFHNSDLDSLDSSNSVVAERRYQSIQDASRDGNDTLEKHFEEEMSACYLEHRPNTSTPHPITVSVNSEDMSKPESMLSPRESDTTSDYGTMIMDSRRGYTSFTLDSGEEEESVMEDNPSPADRVFPPTYDITRSSQGVVNVPAWLQVGTETYPLAEENAVESVLPEGQQLCTSQNSRKMHTIPSSTTVPSEVEYMSNLMSEDHSGETRRTSLSSEEEEVITEETIIVSRPFGFENLPGSENVANVQIPILPSTETQEEKHVYKENESSSVEVNDESSESSYRTPQQSPITVREECEENVVIPDVAPADTETLPKLHLDLNLDQKSTISLPKSVKLKSASVNTDMQQTPHGIRGRTVDDISVREELKRELQQKLAKLQRHVRSFSDSAISSDYTDGDSTSVSPRGSRLYESDKTLRAGIFMEHMNQRTAEGFDVMTTQSDMQFNPSNGESFLSAVSKIVDIDNKEPKKSPLKDSGNVFDDDYDDAEQVEEIIEPIVNNRNTDFPPINDNTGEILHSEQARNNGQTKSSSSNSLNQEESFESSLDKSAEGINYHDGSREYGSDLDYSDVLYTDETSDSRSFSPGEIYLDESTPEKMFRSLAVDDPSQESSHEDIDTELANPSEYNFEKKMPKKSSHHLHPSNREKSPSMSDIQTIVEKSDDVRRSYSENNIDEFEEEDSNSGSSNDSIVFVFMGQSPSKNNKEKLKPEVSGKMQDMEVNSELHAGMDKDGSLLYSPNTNTNSSFSEGAVFRPIEDPSIGHNNGKEYGQFESHSSDNVATIDGQELHHGISCESPLRHRFGIDESVLPIPERSVSSDNLQKLATSKQIIPRSRSASLLDVGVTDNPHDPSNNEGIFPPCVEDYESSVGSREAHGIEEDRHIQDLQESLITPSDTDGMHLKKSSTEPGDHDFENQEIVGAVGSQELLYSSLPLDNSSNREGSTDQVDYNGNLPTKEQITIKPRLMNSLSNEPSSRFVSPDVQASTLDSETQTEDTNDEATAEVGNDVPLVQQHILPALAAPYRARSADNLGQPDALTAMNFSEETDNWQNTSTIAIETNALLSKINDNRLPMDSNSSLDESLKSSEEIRDSSNQDSKITQTGGSLTNLQDLEVQTDLYLDLSMNQSTDSASTQTDHTITKPRGNSETETNDYLPLTVVMQFHNSSTQTDEEDGQTVHSSNSSIQSDTFNNVICRLSDAMKTENTSENTSKINEINSTCYEKAKSPLKLRAGVKSVTRVMSRAEGSGSDSDVFDSTSNLSVDGQIVREEKHEKQHQSKFSDDKSQTVITERECVVENQVHVPNMEFTNAEMDALRSEHAKMMETLKKASEDRQARKEALKAKLSRLSTRDHLTDIETEFSASYHLTQNTTKEEKNIDTSVNARSEAPSDNLNVISVDHVDSVVSRNNNEDENVDLDRIFEENQKYCSTHKVSDNLSDIVVNSDDDKVEAELKPSEKNRPRNVKTLKVKSDLSAKTELDMRHITNIQHETQDVEQNKNRGRYAKMKVFEDEIIPVYSNRENQNYFKPLNLEERNREQKSTTSTVSPSGCQYLSKSTNLKDELRRSSTQTINIDTVQRHADTLGSPTTTTPPNSPTSVTLRKEDFLTVVCEPLIKPTRSNVVDASNRRYDSPSFSSDVTHKPEKGGKISTGIDVHIDSSDDFTQTEIESLKINLSSLDRDSDRILRNRDGAIKDEKTVKQELGKLKKERIEIIELLSMNYLPASLTVELLEAKLNYCIGQTDMLLKTLEDKCELDIMLETDFSHSSYQNETTREYVANYRSDLYKSKQEIELCKQKMERKLGRGRGRKITRNKDVFKLRRNAEIEAFKVERMIEQRNYEHSRSLSPLKSANTSHNDSMERLSRSVSPSSTDSSPHHMTPMEHKNHLVGLRKKLIEETEHDEFVHRISRSCSPQSFISENEFSSPRCRSYSPSHSVWSPEHHQRSPYGSNTVLSPHSDSYSYPRSYSHSPIRNVGVNRNDTYSSGMKSPLSYSPRSSLSPQRQLVSSVVPRRPYSSLERRMYESTDTYEETRELFQEIQAARLQNQQEISRAQNTLGSLRQKKDSPVRSRSNSAASSKRSYSSYRDYAKDVVDNSRRSMHGSVTGSYELYGDDAKAEVISPNSSVMSDLDSLVVTDSNYSHTSSASEKYSRTRPVKSSDIKYKLYQKRKFPK